MSSRRHLFKKKAHTSDEMSLQITSMADIFTIILVFLLKSYATSSINVSPSSGVQIPLAKADPPQVQALTLEIPSGSFLGENKPVIQLADFHFPAGDIQDNRTSKSVNQALEVE